MSLWRRRSASLLRLDRVTLNIQTTQTFPQNDFHDKRALAFSTHSLCLLTATPAHRFSCCDCTPTTLLVHCRHVKLLSSSMAQPAPHEGGGMLPPTVPLRGSTVAATGSSGAMPTTRSDSTADFVDYDDTTDCSSQYTGSVCTTPRSKSSFRRAKGRPKGKSKGKSKGKQLRAKRSARSTTSSRSSSRRGSSSTQK